MTTRVRSAVPTFLVHDVGVTARWYADHLGFVIAGTFPREDPFAYASLQLGAAEIMLLRLADYQKPDLTSLRPEGLWDAYLRTSGVAALYERWKSQSFVIAPLTRQPYGDLEFEVRDPNGYIIVFGGD